MKITQAQYRALDDLAWFPEVWWHDLPAGTRDVLHRRGWLRVVRRARCSTHGYAHPGYVTISKRGLDALRALER